MKTSKKRLQELAAINNPFVEKNEVAKWQANAEEVDADKLKQVIRKANSMDSNTVAAIEDGYYALVDNLPNLVNDLEKVVKMMRNAGSLNDNELLETAIAELKIYNDVLKLTDLSALGKIL